EMTENKKEERKKTDEEVLFPEMKVKVKGVEYVVKPWSFGELLEVNPTLEKIFIFPYISLFTFPSRTFGMQIIHSLIYEKSNFALLTTFNSKIGRTLG
ncbi:MAG: hypothetical protein R6V37_01590, partial [Psychroflexus maritimus]